jgi:hypothetical protein
VINCLNELNPSLEEIVIDIQSRLIIKLLKVIAPLPESS